MKAALLGTGRFTPENQQDDLPIIARIGALGSDREDRFLKTAFTALLYEEAGAKPSKIDHTLPGCPPETRQPAGDKITGLIHASLKDRNEVLFRYYLFRLVKSGKVLQSWLVPMVLNKALNSGKDRLQLLDACGQAGQWLCRLNPKWSTTPATAKGDENIWETGTLEERKTYLTSLRKTDPEGAIALLENTLAEENAGNRLIFVQLLSEGLSLRDEPFLQKLTSDKSQKVKETAFDLLKQIPGSALNHAYLEALTRVLEVREEKHLLITKKKVLTIRGDMPLDDGLFKTGIERVSREKGVEDYVYHAAQLMAWVDPVVLANALGTTEQQLITFLLGQKAAGTLMPFLVRAAVRFRNKAWCFALLHREEATDIRLLDALEESERQAFYGRFLNNNLTGLLTYLFDDNYTPLPLKLAGDIIDYLIRFPYNVTQAVYHRLALHLPVAAFAKLQAVINDPRQDYQTRYFKTQASEMMRIKELIQQID
ncbi:DUF5691 domain-containing protein [Dyadobacter sp. 676]|uniref:DUF5691 domain-containing protein n=1 Tax=Dyadobacter sp. 676 TaxID=3088362 RepID=A0AAU8FKC1_9BACT